MTNTRTKPRWALTVFVIAVVTGAVFLQTGETKPVQNGQVRPLTQEEAQKLAEGIKQVANKSTEGLVSVKRADGSVSMDLQGRFQNVAVAKKNPDGTISQACVDTPEAAAKFFEIDPRLIEEAIPRRPPAKP